MALEVASVKVPPKCAGGCSWERLSGSVEGSKGNEASQALDVVAFTKISEGPGYPSVSRVILQAKERYVVLVLGVVEEEGKIKGEASTTVTFPGFPSHP